jgi:NitT/TauT family transport system permease protein
MRRPPFLGWRRFLNLNEAKEKTVKKNIFQMLLDWSSIPLRLAYKCCKVNAQPAKPARVMLPWLLFVVALMLYAGAAYVRHKDNPDDKLVPTPIQMVEGFSRMAYNPDSLLNDSATAAEISVQGASSMAGRWTQFVATIKRVFSDNSDSGQWLNPKSKEMCLLVDTITSTKRFLLSLAIIFFSSLLIGLLMRMPYLELLLYRFILFFDKTPPIALLPILFIVFGLDEVSKVALIVIAVVPSLVLDLYLRVKAYPNELVIKSMTLGAGTFNIIFRTILPRVFPEFLDALRLKFKDIVAYLLIGETLAAMAGLGYRIFVVRRYMAMDVIIPYVLWISLLAFLADLAVRMYIKKNYPWFNK